MKAQELEQAIQNSFDGTATDDEVLALRAALKSDPQARAAYYEHAGLQQALDYRFARGTGTETISLLAKARLRAQAGRSARIALFAAAAAVMFAALLLRMILVPPAKPIATLDSANGSVLAVSGGEGGSDQASGELSKDSMVDLTQGSLELTFHHGSRAVILAPARFTLHSDKQLRLEEGTAWFRIEEGGHGFEVITPELHVTDLGTEFGVRSDPAAGDEIHVFKGKVVAKSRYNRGDEATLVAGVSRATDPIGRLILIDSEPAMFLARLPEAPSDGLIVNGGFEAGNTPPNASYGVTATPALLPGWLFGPEVTIAAATLAGHPGYGEQTVTILSSTADVQVAFQADTPHQPDAEDVTLRQAFATEPGEEYVVEFEMGAIFFGEASLELTAAAHRGTDIAGSPLAVITAKREHSQGDGYNPPARFTFTAASTVTTLAFTETSTFSVSSDPVLDNVSVRPLR